MTEKEGILIDKATGRLFTPQLAAIYGSIQNYRRYIRNTEGLEADLEEATSRWVGDVERPIMQALQGDPVIRMAMGGMRYNLFFELLYRTEMNGYRFDINAARLSALRRSSGFRGQLARLMA